MIINHETGEAFQFTPLREGRPHSPSRCRPPRHFNSRPSARGDALSVTWRTCSIISIHAPPRGATDWLERAAAALAYFNSRPSARGDWRTKRRRKQNVAFQFTPLREGRPTDEQPPRAATTFQFTPLREGRPRPDAGAQHGRAISIHAPPRGATHFLLSSLLTQ